MDNDKILQTLRDTPFFNKFKDRPDKLSVIASFMTVRFVPAQATIIQENTLGTEMFVLQRGEVEVNKLTMQKENFMVVRLSDETHPIFGELALVDEDKRSATITAVRDCELVVLNRPDFEQLGDANPDIGLTLMRELSRILSRRLRQTNDDVIMLFEALVNEVTANEIN